MERSFYIELAASGARFPVGTDLVLRSHPNSEEILLDGPRLGQVIAEAARTYRSPLAVPLMDLTIEKQAIAHLLGVPESEEATFHLEAAPDTETRERVLDQARSVITPRMQANVEALRTVGGMTGLTPVGMCIGPFSLMTKLLADPIAPVFLADTGVTAEEDPEVAMMEAALELGLAVILRSLELQAEAGAKAMFVCEPAANRVYLSPKRLRPGEGAFERYVMAPNRRIRACLRERDVDLIFHDCGELADAMVAEFASLDPAILSLGSSRNLWEDAERVPKSTVLYGNLPTKRFYSDELTLDEVQRLSREIVDRMRAVGHPHILGSECDVLSVPEKREAILSKVTAFMEA